MEILFVLVPISLALIALAVWVLRWAIRSGQYDDLDGPAHRILFDDNERQIPPESRSGKATEKPDEINNKDDAGR